MLPCLPDVVEGTSPTCSIECGVSSPVSTTPSCSGFSRYENHSSWLVMWFDGQYFVRFWGGLLHRICLVSHHEGWPLFDSSGSLRSFGVVRSLLISLFGPPGSGFGFLRIGASSSTCSPFGPSSHNTNILLQPLFCRFSAPPRLPLLVEGPKLFSALPLCLLSCSCWSRYYCKPTHLVLHAHGAVLPPCTTSSCPIE